MVLHEGQGHSYTTPHLSAPTGIEAAPTTVTVSGVRPRILLHRPLPDGSITDYKDELNTLGGLAREPAGVIRT